MFSGDCLMLSSWYRVIESVVDPCLLRITTMAAKCDFMCDGLKHVRTVLPGNIGNANVLRILDMSVRLSIM